MHPRLLLALLGGALTALGALPAASELAFSDADRVLYEWTDAAGVVRYTAHEGRVPEAARPGTLVIRQDVSGGVVVARWGEEPAERLASAAPLLEPDASGAPLSPPELSPPPVSSAAPFGPAAPPPARPAAAKGEAYAVQLGAHSLSEWVRPLAGSGVLEGRALYRTTVALDGVLWERLRVGFFSSQAEARAARAQVAPHFAGAWIARAEPGERSESLEGSIASAGLAPRETGEAPDGEGPVWVVQLAARPLLDGLRDLTRLDLLDRHHVYLSTADVDGETWERLRLGFFPSRERARAVLRELAGSHPDAWVARVDPDEQEGSAILD